MQGDSPVRPGQAHIAAYSIGAVSYAFQAIHRASSHFDADAAVAREKDWLCLLRHQRLLRLFVQELINGGYKFLGRKWFGNKSISP